MLSHIAARTSRIRLFTAVTTLSLLGPVRAFEDYSTLDNLAGGRLELVKGNGVAQRELFHVTPDDQWDRSAEGYELFRRLWREDKVTWSGHPRPRPRCGRGRCSNRSACGTAARPAATRWTSPRNGVVRCSRPTSPTPPNRTWTSQEALETYRPIFESRPAFRTKLGLEPVFRTLDDFVERSSALVGSPAQVVDKVLRYHKELGHQVMHLHADRDGLTARQHRDALELFQSDVAPALRREIPAPAWPD